MLRGTDRLTSLNTLLQEKLQDTFMNTFSTTQFDWTRSRGACIYFNGNRVFQNEEITNAEVEHFFKNLEQKVNPDLLKHIKNHANQNGFLNVTEEFTKSEILENKNINLTNNAERYDFIIHNEKSITFIERFYIENYQDAGTFKKAQSGNNPIACCVTTSKIELISGTINHKISDDIIYVLNEKLGTVLFNDISFTESYEKSFAEIEKTLNAEVNFLVTLANNKVTAYKKSSDSDEGLLGENLHIGYLTELENVPHPNNESVVSDEESPTTPGEIILKNPTNKNPNYKKHIGLMTATWTVAGGLLSSALQVLLEYPIPGITGAWVPVAAGVAGAGAGFILGGATGFATVFIKRYCSNDVIPEYTIVTAEAESDRQDRSTKNLSQIKIQQTLGLLDSSQSDEDMPAPKPATDASEPINFIRPESGDVGGEMMETPTSPLYYFKKIS